jgi:hypothetical protein
LPLGAVRTTRGAFTTVTPEELQSLATEDPVMAQAKNALERLSSDPEARVLAEERRKAQVYMTLRDARSREEGRVTMLREAIAGYCELLALPLTEERREEIASAAAERLEHIASHLRTHRTWP